VAKVRREGSGGKPKNTLTVPWHTSALPVFLV